MEVDRNYFVASFASNSRHLRIYQGSFWRQVQLRPMPIGRQDGGERDGLMGLSSRHAVLLSSTVRLPYFPGSSLQVSQPPSTCSEHSMPQKRQYLFEKSSPLLIPHTTTNSFLEQSRFFFEAMSPRAFEMQTAIPRPPIKFAQCRSSKIHLSLEYLLQLHGGQFPHVHL